MSEILRFENISLNVEKKTLFNFSLTINAGDFFIVNGKNAAGKSLLLKLFFLKILPSNGKMFLYGKRITENQKINIYFAGNGILRKNLIENFLKNILYIEQDRTLTMKLMILITWQTMQSK